MSGPLPAPWRPGASISGFTENEAIGMRGYLSTEHRVWCGSLEGCGLGQRQAQMEGLGQPVGVFQA